MDEDDIPCIGKDLHTFQPQSDRVVPRLSSGHDATDLGDTISFDHAPKTLYPMLYTDDHDSLDLIVLLEFFQHMEDDGIFTNGK